VEKFQTQNHNRQAVNCTQNKSSKSGQQKATGKLKHSNWVEAQDAAVTARSAAAANVLWTALLLHHTLLHKRSNH
jgi:hypothetical protein